MTTCACCDDLKSYVTAAIVKGASPPARLVLRTLADYTDPRTGQVDDFATSRAFMVRETGLSARKVVYMFRELESLDLMERTDRPGDPSGFRLCTPAGTRADPAPLPRGPVQDVHGSPVLTWDCGSRAGIPSSGYTSLSGEARPPIDLFGSYGAVSWRDRPCPTCKALPGHQCLTENGTVAHSPHRPRVHGVVVLHPSPRVVRAAG